MKKFLCAITLVLALVMAVGCESKSDKPKLEAIKEAGVLVVGTSADYPPFQFHTEIEGEDTIVGAEIALAKYIADSIGVEMKIVDMSFDSLVAALADGQFDIVASTMRPSEKRKEVVDFTDSWYENKSLIVVKAENAEMFKQPEDLAGHKVAAQTGASQYDQAVEFAGQENAVGLAKVQNLIMEVQAGRIDAAIMEGMTAEVFASANDDLAAVDIDIPRSGDGAAIGVRKGDAEFVEYLNTLIAEALESGKMADFIAEAGAYAMDVE